MSATVRPIPNAQIAVSDAGGELGVARELSFPTGDVVVLNGVATITPTVASDANYVHTQETPSASWTVAHNLGKRAAVQVVDSAGTQVEGDVTWLTENTVQIDFASPFSGRAFCN